MTTESDDIAFLENNDALDPVAFFKWKNYTSQEDKQRAHSAYTSLTSKAQSTAEWRNHAALMKRLWDKRKNDGSILDFWTTLPKHSLTRKIQKIQGASLIKNIKRLHSRDDALSETIDAGLIQAARSEITPGTSLPGTASSTQNYQQGAEVSPTAVLEGTDCSSDLDDDEPADAINARYKDDLKQDLNTREGFGGIGQDYRDNSGE
ncbi:hypothetical protein BGX26_006215, partial [Mortierella sp. AD094]